jgi:hypothetical protein
LTVKAISIFAIGAIVSNMATTHPNLFYLALSILAGFLLALLVAFVFIGPSPKPPTVTTPAKQQANVTQARKVAKRQGKKPARSRMQWGIEIVNYPQGAMA